MDRSPVLVVRLHDYFSYIIYTAGQARAITIIAGVVLVSVSADIDSFLRQFRSHYKVSIT